MGAEITARVVPSSGAAAPSLGVIATLELTSHHSPWPGQPKLHWQSTCSTPKQNSLPWIIQSPQGRTKAFSEKFGFTLRIRSCE